MSNYTSNCPNCEAKSYTRNHYFTGKFMVERDFTDEQRYFIEKIRLHHQRLHGSGVVCGLQLQAHHNPECQDRYVILQPGSAVDCCGKDILVVEPEIIDLYQFPAIQALQQAGDDQTHALQLCIRYRECPTEPIPKLYDECGYDDNQCAPNRILESFAVELYVDQPLPETRFHRPRAYWRETMPIAEAAFAALDDVNHRLFVVTAGDTAILYEVDAENPMKSANEIPSWPVSQHGLALALAHDASSLYLVRRGAVASDSTAAELLIFSSSTVGGISAGPVRQASIEGSEEGDIRAAVAADGRLVVLVETPGIIAVWAPGVPNPGSPEARREIGSSRFGLALAADGKTAYCLSLQSGQTQIHAIYLSDQNLPERTITIPDVLADDIVAVSLHRGNALALLDRSGKTLRLITLSGDTATEVDKIDLSFAPYGLVIPGNGQWGFVLERNGQDSFLQIFNSQPSADGQSILPPVMVGSRSMQIVGSSARNRLFIPFLGDQFVQDMSDVDDGGVAVVPVLEENCADLLGSGEDCPTCDGPDCLTLAVVENYHLGDRLQDLQSPIGPGIARLDHRRGRVDLPSTQVIARALECLLNPFEQPQPKPKSKNFIGTWLILGPIFDIDHQTRDHFGDDGHPKAGELIEAVSSPTNTGKLNPAELSHIANLDSAPVAGDMLTYGLRDLVDDRQYFWRVRSFNGIDWFNIHDVEDNIHLHLPGDELDDAYDAESYANFADKHHALAFFLLYVHSLNSEDLDSTLWVRSDDSVRVWLNGAEIEELKHSGERDIIDFHEIGAPVRIHPGNNILLLAVSETHFEWGFSARLAPDAGLRFFTHNPERPREPYESNLEYVSIPGEANGWRNNDPNRILQLEGKGRWRGRIRLADEKFKFFLRKSGAPNGGDFFPDNNIGPKKPGFYEVVFRENPNGNHSFDLVPVKLFKPERM